MKKTIIIDNIVTPYSIARHNEINKVLKGKLEVWYQAKTEPYRLWKSLSKIYFQYRILRYFPEIYQLLSQYRDQVVRVVCHGWSSLTYLYTFWFCKRNKIRFTLWSESTIYEKSIWRTLSLPLVKFIVSQASDYIACGTRSRDYLIYLGADRKKIKIFLNTVDVDFFNKTARELAKKRIVLRNKYGFKENDRIFLFIGQLINRKGIIELIEAFATITQTVKNIGLLVVGEGYLRLEINRLINQYYWANIKLIGFIQYNDLPKLYTISDILILPSKEEVWGLVVNEALSSNLPVIVSKVAGASFDLINKENGIIIDEVNQEGITEAIRQYLTKKRFQISVEVLNKMRIGYYAKENFS